jgi:hypothetical protein
VSVPVGGGIGIGIGVGATPASSATVGAPPETAPGAAPPLDPVAPPLETVPPPVVDIGKLTHTAGA